MTDSTHPLVTIAIPTYNRADGYLRLALESALGQTYPNVEVIVSDNCSTDGTEAVVKSYAAPHLRYYRHSENIGANSNFNFCLEQAEGAYFLLLHDDDMIDADFCESCIKAADARTDVGIIRTGTRTIDPQGTILTEKPNDVVGLSTSDFFLGWFAGKTSLYLCSTLFNTQKLKEIGGFHSPHQLFQDVIAEVRLAALHGRVDVRDVKASFRRHADARTLAQKVKLWSEDSLVLLEMMCDLAPDRRERVRREGNRFFAKVNYQFASASASPLQRLAAYWIVYKAFGYRYPPFYFPLRRAYRRGKRRALRLAKRARQRLVRVADAGRHGGDT